MKSEWTQAQVNAQNTKVFNNRFGKSVEMKTAAQHNAGVAGSMEFHELKSHLESGAELKPMKTRSKSGYNKAVVLAYFRECGVPEPEVEYQFHPDRKWRFDFAWPFFAQVGRSTDEEGGIYLEVDGGLWVQGGHNRGAQMKKDWEKRTAATELMWRGLWVEPKDLCTQATVDLIKRALGI